MFKNIVLLILFLSPVLTAQDDFNNRFMLASRFEQAGEYEKAKDILEDLYLKQPASYQVFEVLNRVYIQLKDYEKSEKIINARLAANPLDVNMYGLLGKTYHIKGDEQKAFDTWDKALELSGGNLSFYRVIANYAVERRSFGKAVEILTKGKEKAPDPHIFSYDIANLYAITMNYTKAAEEYVFILDKLPQEVHNVRSRMNGYLNKPEAVKPTLEVFSKAKNRNAEIKSILAWLYVEDKNFDEAYKLYKDLDKERGAGGGDVYNYAQMLFSIKEYQKAAEIFSDIMNNSSSQLVSAAKMGYAKSMEEILNLQKKEMRNVRTLITANLTGGN
jgi:tetratricopeptide (TPR) repeat protein